MKKSYLALALSAFSFSTIAAEFTPHSYTYIEAAGFERTTEWPLDASLSDEVDSDGGSVGGSFRTENGVLFQAHYAEGEIDEAWGLNASQLANVFGSRVDFDTESWDVLIGGANQINRQMSAWGGFGYGRETVEFNADGWESVDTDIEQYSIGGGVRYSPIEYVELNAGARLVHFRADESDLLDDFIDTDVEVTVGARLQPIQWVSVGVSYSRQLDADANVTKADVRFQF